MWEGGREGGKKSGREEGREGGTEGGRVGGRNIENQEPPASNAHTFNIIINNNFRLK